MRIMLQRWGAALVAALAVAGASAPAARAQLIPGRAALPPVNPAFTVTPGLQIYNNAYNAAVLGQTIRQFPPWAFGFNPYPSIGGGPLLSTAGGYGGGPGLLISPGGSGGYGGSSLTTNPYGYGGASSGNGGYGGASSGSGGYGGYGGQGYGGNTYGTMDPNYGFLSGAANAIDASGEYWKQIQQARILETQADQGRLGYRRSLIDEARYERGLLPTTEEMRQQDLGRNLAYARHEPPITDVISGRSLNAILNHLRDDPAVGKGPNVPLDDEVLRRINVTSPNRDGASLGLLKDGGKLQWPQSLSGKEFDTARTDLSRRLEDVVGDLKFSNPIQQGKIKDLNADREKLRNMVEKSELSPTDYIDARAYLDQVGAAIQALQDPNVVANFNHKFNAKNVAELVDGMKGLDFGPAAPGDEWAYRMLQQALVAYDAGASPQASAPPSNDKPPSPPPPAAPAPTTKPPY
jgi:hypothetical protein